MSTAETVKAQLNALLNQANNTTGNTDANLTAAIASLAAGFGQGGSGGGLAYDMGEFVLEADSNVTSKVYISHNLGEKPGFILVWTDDYVGVTNPDESNATALGFVWFNQIMGLENYFSTTSKGEGTTVNFTQSKAKDGMNVVKPTSASYTLTSDFVSAESFKLVKNSANTYYRGGTTYKYFVSKAWWNIGGVASAE